MVNGEPSATYVLEPVGVSALIEQVDMLIGSCIYRLLIVVDPTWTVALNSIVYRPYTRVPGSMVVKVGPS